MVASRLAVLACAAACFSLASAKASGSGSGSDDLLADEDTQKLPAGNGEAPPADRVAYCFAKASNVSELSVSTCANTWVGVIKGARAACLDDAGGCKDATACKNAMAIHAKSLMELCRAAQDEYHPENIKDCLSGFDNNAVDALLDPNNYFDGDIKHHFDLLEIAAKCDALPEMEMVEDAPVTTYTDLRKVLYQACTASNPSLCAAQKQAQDTALAVQKYTETSRIVAGQDVSTAVLCEGRDPNYEPADINKCKLAEMVVTRAGLEHCQPDCGMAGQRPCRPGDHSHGVACKTSTCVDYLNYLGEHHFDIVETDCSDARFNFNKLTTDCPGPRLGDTVGGRTRRQDKNAKKSADKNSKKAVEDAGKNSKKLKSTAVEDTKGEDANKDNLLDEPAEGPSLPGLVGSTVGPATAPVDQGANRPVFLHGKDVLAFVTVYLAERCGASTSNIPKPSPDFMFLYKRIVTAELNECSAKRDATSEETNPDGACANQNLAALRVTTVQRVADEANGVTPEGSAATTLTASALLIAVNVATFFVAL